MKKYFESKAKKLIGFVFAVFVTVIFFSFDAEAAMSVSEVKDRLSSYSDCFDTTEKDVFYLKYDRRDISQEEMFDVINDVAARLMGEPVEDYCQVEIKFFYSDKLYGRSFDGFKNGLMKIKSKLDVFWPDWGRYNSMVMSATSYNRVCDEYSANVTLHMNGSKQDNRGKRYDAKLLEIVKEAEKKTKNDMELVQYYLKWLDENADYRAYTGYTNDSYYALIIGKTVCGGYANAFRDLCSASGIPAIVPISVKNRHAWSEVYVNGKWYTADLCDIVKSKSGKYKGCLFTDPTIKMDDASFVKEHKSEYVSSFKDASLKSIDSCKFTLKSSLSYTGSALTPSVTVKDGSKTLKAGTHYKIKYSANKLPGTGKVTVEGIKKGGYKDQKELTFKITLPKVKVSSSAGKNEIKLSWDKVSKASGYILKKYNSKTEKYETVGKIKAVTYTFKSLKAGTSYKFSLIPYVTVSGKDYKGSETKLTVKTTPDKVRSLKISSVNSTSLKLSWAKVTGAESYEIYISTDGESWKKKGTSEKTSYTVKKLKANKKYYFRVRAVNTSGKGSFSSKKSAETLLSAPILTVAAQKGSAALTWNNVSGAEGYEVAYSKSKSFTKKTTKTVTVKKGSSVKKTVKKLSKGTKYYFRIRAYKTVDGEKVYGKYSSVKNVITKIF